MGQSIACIATQMNNGQGKEKENQTGSREILFAYDEHRLLGEYDRITVDRRFSHLPRLNFLHRKQFALGQAESMLRFYQRFLGRCLSDRFEQLSEPGGTGAVQGKQYLTYEWREARMRALNEKIRQREQSNNK